MDATPLVFGQAGPQKVISQNTPYNISISVAETPGHICVEGLRQVSADRASELLMLNHAKFHTLFDYVGFHSKCMTLCH